MRGGVCMHVDDLTARRVIESRGTASPFICVLGSRKKGEELMLGFQNPTFSSHCLVELDSRGEMDNHREEGQVRFAWWVRLLAC